MFLYNHPLFMKPDNFTDIPQTWDGMVMSFKDNSFDTLMATEVLEHCPDTHGLIREMKRVLKPGGLVFLLFPFSGICMKCRMMNIVLRLLHYSAFLKNAVWMK